ncbi:GNAT family N-acetyltransferase [Kordiimonas sp. SCSIO 12603]|uniref:GNAT family N-acetyltransferase n=1 Tax=Kordiimonas sp. SCSIO 12603 TaxID=2829596 RepID=UPI0021040E3C|nr:GNAT family N-acetyltransferase [Kordiimonas sp. SCSIO 12603]UTW58982.1 GNAT family N-acetyltransferase [Kordiimonas sp. SCSIO 12603]
MLQMKQASLWSSPVCAISATNMAVLNIRNADEGDLAFILKLEASPNGNFVHGDNLETHQRQIVDKDFIYLIGEVGGDRAGYAILVKHADNIVEWRRIMVAKTGGGIGSRFMQETITHIFSTDTKTIKLDVYSDNERARHLYSRLGFQETHTSPCHRDKNRTLVFMELSA